MATILIADDNSNIQKMVTLAFKDEGIDVVSVGNGEAAVRKAPEIMPDLVLADIFMPVRNGYEVCEFIKHDTRLAHVPVILLTGAFDPFDEREAQRVGADGVLKKPFVPSEPLVALVKELLAKAAAEHLVPVSVTAAEKNSIAAPAVPPETSAPRAIAPPLTAFEVPAEEEPEEIRPFKAFTFKEEPANSQNHGGASAFGSFLDATTQERIEPASAHANDHADAREDLPAGLHSPQPSIGESERRAAPVEGLNEFSNWLIKTPGLDSATSALDEPMAPIFSPSADRITRNWEIVPSSKARPEDETIVEPLDHFAATHFPAATDNRQKTESAGARTNEFEEEVLADATAEVSRALDAAGEAQSGASTFAPSMSAPSMDDTQTIEAIRSSSMPWHSAPSKFHELQHLVHEEAVEEPSERSAEPYAEVAAMGSENAPIDEIESEAPVYEAGAMEDSLPAVIPSSNAESFPVPVRPTMDAQQLEEIISRVVERMQPQVLDVITREILRPVVEALVRRQLEVK